MKIEIYLDTLFLMNLVINLWILSLLKKRFSLGTGGLRMMAAAGIGAAAYIGMFWLPTLWNAIVPEVIRSFLLTFVTTGSVLWQLLAVCLTLPVMTRMILTKRKKYLWKKVMLQGLLYSFIIAGVLRAVLHKWSLLAGQEITFFTVLFGIYICVQIGSFCIRKSRQFGRKSICRVVINSSGTKTDVKALLDTGNSLLEPISGKPVCLAEEELLARITLENPLFYRAIPFRSVGCEQGILYGVEIPELTIINEEQCYVATNVICAGVPQKLSHKNKYQMILHPALCTEENRQNG